MTKEQFEPQDEKYWAERPVDDQHRDWNPEAKSWIEDYTGSVSHPHRSEIVKVLQKLQPFDSLLEVGCNSGPNIAKIRDNFGHIKDTELVGVDINADAISAAKEIMPGVMWKVASAKKLPFEDKSFDCVLFDAVLIYVDPKEIEGILKEADRVARKTIILVEWYNKEEKIVDYHWARDYPRLLKKFGFEVEKIKLKENQWPNTKWIKHGYIFIATRQKEKVCRTIKKGKKL